MADREREERKALLRDWLTATTQLIKVEYPNLNAYAISQIWRRGLAIKMTPKWVDRALYGAKPPKKEKEQNEL